MALVRVCNHAIPCVCHLSPPVEIRPGVYKAGPWDVVNRLTDRSHAEVLVENEERD